MILIIYHNSMQIVGPEIDPFLKTLRPKQLEEYQAAFETPEVKPPPSIKKDKKTNPPPRQQPRHVHQHANDDSDDSDASVAEFTCPFCDRQDDAFDSDRLDQHFWAECPMLTQCQMCSQVIEISTLNEHLLVECEQKECRRCGEAITAKFYDKHTNMNDCDPMPSPAQGNRCRGDDIRGRDVGLVEAGAGVDEVGFDVVGAFVVNELFGAGGVAVFVGAGVDEIGLAVVGAVVVNGFEVFGEGAFVG
ncbi:hypothetical protein DYB38_005304 [Aphanomyces astaci]|uniref:Centrosomal protein CEP104 Zn finger domain-containing protein n=1 Tax=Aphanomyces astaci TaxID=112090 RepID=A0A397CX94_APHAT|nr:hypothetical protein DYB38_005304 [Aphanomyces astaci]